MSPLQVTTLSLRLFGILVWVLGLSGAPSLFLFSEAGSPERLAYLWITAAYLGLGAALIFLPSRIAALVLAGSPGDVDADRTSAETAEGIAFSVLGLFVILRAGAGLASRALALEWVPVWSRIATLGALVLVLAGGVWLFLGSRGCIRLGRRFQDLGLRGEESAPDRGSASHRGQMVAFSVLGLYVLFTGLEELSRGLIALDFGGGDFASELWSLNERLISVALLRVLLGAALFFRSGRVASFWGSLQERRA